MIKQLLLQQWTRVFFPLIVSDSDVFEAHSLDKPVTLTDKWFNISADLNLSNKKQLIH